jgi:hypothetical protein
MDGSKIIEHIASLQAIYPSAAGRAREKLLEKF